MSYKIFVGAYTSVITTLLFNPATPSLSVVTTSPAGTNPSWIAGHPTNQSLLFATQENYSGQVISFLVDANGAAKQLAVASSGGQNPAYLAVSSSGTDIYVPNYNSGQYESIPITNSGAGFGSPSPVLQLTGSGPNTGRQTSSHPHEAVENGSGEVLVPDLGADKVWRLTKSGNSWTPAGFVQNPAGSGPRHIVVAGSNLYTLHELSNTLTQHTLPPLNSGTVPQLVATIPVIPTGASNTTLGAGELFISPVTSSFPTQYLYASNRGDTDPAGDTIAIFSLNPLTLVKQVRTGLQGLRGVTIGGDQGQYIVAGGQNGGGIKVFQRISGGADLKEIASVSGVGSPTSFVIVGPSGSAGAVTTTTSSATTSVSVSSTLVTSAPQTTQTAGPTASHYQQCGGIGYTGPTTCASPWTCVKSGDYYSQCL